MHTFKMAASGDGKECILRESWLIKLLESTSGRVGGSISIIEISGRSNSMPFSFLFRLHNKGVPIFTLKIAFL